MFINVRTDLKHCINLIILTMANLEVAKFDTPPIYKTNAANGTL